MPKSEMHETSQRRAFLGDECRQLFEIDPGVTRKD